MTKRKESHTTYHVQVFLSLSAPVRTDMADIAPWQPWQKTASPVIMVVSFSSVAMETATTLAVALAALNRLILGFFVSCSFSLTVFSASSSSSDVLSLYNKRLVLISLADLSLLRHCNCYHLFTRHKSMKIVVNVATFQKTLSSRCEFRGGGGGNGAMLKLVIKRWPPPAAATCVSCHPDNLGYDTDQESLFPAKFAPVDVTLVL